MLENHLDLNVSDKMWLLVTDIFNTFKRLSKNKKNLYELS